MDISLVPNIDIPDFLAANSIFSSVVIAIITISIITIYFYAKQRIAIIYQLFQLLKNIKNKNISIRETAYKLTKLMNMYAISSDFKYSDKERKTLRDIKYKNSPQKDTSELSAIIIKSIRFTLLGKC